MAATTERTDEVRILHVDDEPDFADMAATFLEREDDRFAVETATDAREGRAMLERDEFDCVVSDYDMPGENGIEFLEAVREDHPDLPFILYTGKGGEEVASAAISAGVTDYLQKKSGGGQYAILANRIDNAVAAHRATKAEARTRQRLEQILKTVPECIVQIDRNGEFVFANDRAREVLGLEESDVTDRTYNDPAWGIRDLEGEPIPDEDLPFRQVRDSGEPLYGYRHTIEWPDGTRKVLLVNGAPLFDENGTVESVVFALSDITEHREQETRLRQTTARLQALFEKSPDMIDVHDTAGNILDVNPRLCEKTGYSADELTEMKVWDLDRAIDPEEARDIWAEMEVGERREIEGVYRRRDGSTFPVVVHIRYLDLEGEDRFVAISRDVSERKARERDLEATKRRLEAILENTRTPMFMKDAEGRYIFVNHGYRELFGLHDEEVVGRTDHEIHPPEMADEVTENDRAVLESGESVETEEHITVGGERRTFLTSKVPIYDTGERADPDRPVAVFGVASDITGLKRREAQLQRERDRLERFASVVSHDLRNPLNVAEGRLELAREECDSEHLDAVDRAHDRMAGLIDDLLSLAREGRPVEEMEAVDLGGVAEACWQTVETADATLAVETDRAIRADRSRLRQLLENLIRNAIHHGGEDVTVEIGDLDAEDGFYVADDGPGIPEKERATVFESGYTTAEGGTGFGLAIVKEIAEAHGWAVGVTESAAGGARFEITGVTVAGR
jgi:PAS domain S-box-containing protein